MHWRSLIALTVVMSLLPAGAMAAPSGDGIDEPEAPVGPTEDLVEGPAPADAAAAPVVTAPPAPAALRAGVYGQGVDLARRSA